MKTKKILFALLGVFNISAGVPSVGNRQPDFNSDFALMRFTGNENLTLPISFVKVSNSSYNLVLTIYNAANNASVYTKTYSGSSLGTKLPVQFNVDLPIKNRLKADGLKLEFKHSLGIKNYATEYGIIYPYQKEES